MSANENLTRVAIAFMKITAHTFYMSVVLLSIPLTVQSSFVSHGTKYDPIAGRYQNGMVGEYLPKTLKLKVTNNTTGVALEGVEIKFAVTHAVLRCHLKLHVLMNKE